VHALSIAKQKHTEEDKKRVAHINPSPSSGSLAWKETLLIWGRERELSPGI
jgi:hypothetical protein